MNLIHNPALIEHLASSYALGTLRGGARRRFETLAREHPTLRAAALVWQSRMASMTELQPPVTPSPVVWTRVDNLVQGELSARQMQKARANAHPANTAVQWWRSLGLWRGAAAMGALATVTAVVVGINLRQELVQSSTQVASLQTQLNNAPRVEYVAVLSDNTSAASMLVTFDPKSKKLTLQRVGSYQEASDRSLQLWALPAAGGAKSLGVLGGEKLLRLTASENEVREVPTLAISLEPKGGVPSAGGPTGPVLFKGSLIKQML